jgi:hypothetical protein
MKLTRLPRPRRGDIVAIGLVAALLLLFFIINVFSSGRPLPFNFGFGPEMECHAMGDESRPQESEQDDK